MRKTVNDDAGEGKGSRESHSRTGGDSRETGDSPMSDARKEREELKSFVEFLWQDRELNEAPLPEIPWDRPGGIAPVEIPFLTRGPRKVPVWCLANPIWRIMRRHARMKLMFASVGIWFRFTGPIPIGISDAPSDPDEAPDGDDGRPLDWRKLEDDLERDLRRNLRFRGARIDMSVARGAWMLAHARAYRAEVAWKGAGTDETVRAEARSLAASVIEWMEIACEIAGARAGASYSRDFARFVQRLAAYSDEPAPLGRAVDACRAALARFESRTGRGSDAHRWFLSACSAALDAPWRKVDDGGEGDAVGGDSESPRMRRAVRDGATRGEQLRLLGELLELDRAAPRASGGLALGWTACHLASRLRRAGDSAAAVAHLEEAERDLASFVGRDPAVPHGALQSVRRALFGPMCRAKRLDDYEALLRRMISLEEERAGADPNASADWMTKAPSVGALRSRLARHLESSGRIDEAEACWRAGGGDSYGMRDGEKGIRRLGAFLCRQGRAGEAIELVRESLRRERASATPDPRREFERLVMALDIHRMLEDSAFALPTEERRELARRLIEVTRERVAKGDDWDRSFVRSGAFVAARSGEAALGVELLEEVFPGARGTPCNPDPDGSGDAPEASRESPPDSSATAPGDHPAQPSPSTAFEDFHLAMTLTLAIQQLGERPWERAVGGGVEALRKRAIALLEGAEAGMARSEAVPKMREWMRVRESLLATLLLEEGAKEEAHRVLLDSVAKCERDATISVRTRWRIGRLLIDATEAVGLYSDLGPLKERFPDAPPFVDDRGAFEIWEEESEEDIPPIWGEEFRDPDRRSGEEEGDCTEDEWGGERGDEDGENEGGGRGIPGARG